MDLSGSWEYILSIARSRLAHNITPHHVYAFGEEIEVIGVAGEVAARRYLGLVENVHEGFDNGVDILLGGMKIDVKTTILTPKLNHRFLQWPITKFVKSDVVLFMAVDPLSKQAVAVGYATKNEIAKAAINTTRSNPCREIPVPDLHPSYELIMKQIGYRNQRIVYAH
jgi:hypothetical protein